jgi:uncharacterized membrane protein YGL010W
MPPTIAAFWNKLNTNEKMVMYGAVVVIVAFLLGTVAGGYGSATGDIVAAIVIAVLYWLKYAPNQTMKWPAPIQTIVLVVAGLAAIFAILGALAWLGFFGLGLFGIAIIVNAVGCAVMAWFAYKEYQAMPKMAPPAPPTPPMAPPAA